MMKGYWSRFLHWRGWKKLFPLSIWAAALFFGACCVGLAWVFMNGLEAWWPACILYALSAYGLTALCVRLPSAVRREKRWVKEHPGVERLLKDKELHFRLKLYFEQFINFAYGVFKIVSGTVIGSA